MKSTIKHRTRNTLVAALTGGAALAGAFGAAAPAQAAPDMYIALSYSFTSDISGIAVTNDKEQSRINSLGNCQDKGGNHCLSFRRVTDFLAVPAMGQGIQALHGFTANARILILQG